MQVDEVKTMIKDLHKNGIEVILDVVFNHTAEGDHRGQRISFRGIDNRTYYMLTPEGYYFNFSGCGNTLNCNHPVVRNMVLDCLRYWAAEYHVDGFRFDLASILGRDQGARPLTNPPLLEALAYDPILAKCKLIAEAWDVGGLYQVGSFPAYGRWAEWNGRYRDTIRKFVKGDLSLVGEVSQCIQGSPQLYYQRGPTASINFITCHDGFSLNDLVSYNGKHNELNGEQNNDGANDNNSWNCGYEGETEDLQVNILRNRQIKNFFSILMVSQGVPMVFMGDEMGRTQAWTPDWSSASRVCAFMLCGKHAKQGAVRDDDIYVAMNMYWEALPFSLPRLPAGRRWHVFANTGATAPHDIHAAGEEVPIADQASIVAGGRSVIILVGR